MKTLVYPGTPIADAKRRSMGRGLWLPSLSDQGVVSATSTRSQATVTANAVAHTKGAWIELVTATAKEVTMLTVALTANKGANATNSSCLLDIGIGAAGSEVVLVSDLAMGYKTAGDRFDIPVTVPPLTRIAARCQDVTGGATVAIELTLGVHAFNRRPANHVVTMGDDTSTSHGTALTVPTANTKTAWTQIVASTTEPFGALIVGEQGNTATSFIAGTSLLDIGIGGAGSETVIVADIPYQMNTSELTIPMAERIYPVDVPLGSRLAARWESSSGSNRMDLILYGVPRQ